MGLQTFSILAGSEACNGRCPFCISKMTPPLGIELKEPEVNWRNFEIACRVAKRLGALTAMFTGKGEPTLFPGQIDKYLECLQKYEFPLIELQTNGIKIAEAPERYDSYLRNWHERGMTTIAVSIVHYEPEKNRQIYLPHKKEYIDLPQLIHMLHDYGFSVRLTCIAASGFIDGAAELVKLAAFAKENKVEQLTITPVNKPDGDRSRDFEAWLWTDKHHLTPEQLEDIKGHLTLNGVKLRTLVHGAVVYDLGGQNVCLNNCLSINADSDDLRNLIFSPDGHIHYYWQYEGAILL